MVAPRPPRLAAERHAVPERESFEDAYQRLWPSMVRLGHLLSGSASVGEDIAQDAFIGMHRNWSTVDNADGYMRVAIINRSRTQARRSARTDPHGRPADRPTGIPEIDETWELLRTLNDRQRAAIVLRYYLDLPLGEIADLLGCRPGTVKSAIHRGLARLREAIR